MGIASGLLWLAVSQAWAAKVHHDLRVEVATVQSELRISDRISLGDGAGQGRIEFLLSARAVPEPQPGLQALGAAGRGGAVLYRYEGRQPLLLRYRLPVPGQHGEARHARMPGQHLDNDGLYLDGSGYWHPAVGQEPFSYRLGVDLPDGWRLACGGERDGDGGCLHAAPQPYIPLVAGRYRAYERDVDGVGVQVLLLTADDALAERYLQASAGYLRFYQALLGRYPYANFAVVENRWQTGLGLPGFTLIGRLGLPGFTLIGSRVLRLPFLLASSLPHEILHNWWGNGVYVEAAQGNWSEGLTAYLADYLIQEAGGQGRGYRLRQLAGFADHVRGARDQPLSAFLSRHSDASQAVGYGKALMLFHMLRRWLGDDEFVAGLRRFARDQAFSEAGVDDLVRSLGPDAERGPALADFTRRWWRQPGAPLLGLADAAVVKDGDRYRLELQLGQSQPGEIFPLRVPVAVTLDGRPEAEWRVLALDARSRRYRLEFDARPLRVDIDPSYDLMRLLHDDERPASIGRLFGAEEQWLLLPSAADAGTLAAWRAFAQVWQERFGNVRVLGDAEVDALPPERPAWVLGWDNRHLAEVKIPGLDQVDPSARILVGVDPDAGVGLRGFVGIRDARMIQALASRLTHYGSFGRILFDAKTGENIERERLAAPGGSLTRQFGEQAVPLRLPAESALATQSAAALPRIDISR